MRDDLVGSVLHANRSEVVLAVATGGEAVREAGEVDEGGKDLFAAEVCLGELPRGVPLLLGELRVVLGADKDAWLDQSLEAVAWLKGSRTSRSRLTISLAREGPLALTQSSTELLHAHTHSDGSITLGWQKATASTWFCPAASEPR